MIETNTDDEGTNIYFFFTTKSAKHSFGLKIKNSLAPSKRAAP